MPFSPVGFWTPPGGGGPTVSALATNINHSSTISTVYTSTSYNSDGNEYTNSPVTSLNYTSSRGNAWLTGGNASDVWVQCTLNSGSFNAANAGTGTRLNLGTTRNWAVSDANPTGGSTGSANATWAFYDAASGGNLLDSVTYSITAAYTDTCPTCCFTPDTPILMANGMLMPIGKIRKGDMIAVFDKETRKLKSQEVTGVITRVNRPMFKLHFASGRVMESSDDHPYEVKGKGAASLNHYDTEYKDLGLPARLEVGDLVMALTGVDRLVKIERMDYTGVVFTLENSLFFANGLMVY